MTEALYSGLSGRDLWRMWLGVVVIVWAGCVPAVELAMILDLDARAALQTLCRQRPGCEDVHIAPARLDSGEAGIKIVFTVNDRLVAAAQKTAKEPRGDSPTEPLKETLKAAVFQHTQMPGQVRLVFASPAQATRPPSKTR